MLHKSLVPAPQGASDFVEKILQRNCHSQQMEKSGTEGLRGSRAAALLAWCLREMWSEYGSPYLVHINFSVGRGWGRAEDGRFEGGFWLSSPESWSNLLMITIINCEPTNYNKQVGEAPESEVEARMSQHSLPLPSWSLTIRLCY